MKAIKNFFTNQRMAPFETMFGFFCTYTGTYTLVRILIGNAPRIVITLGFKTALVFSILYSIAGLMMFIGIGLGKKNIEAFGLTTVISSIMAQLILSGWLTGFNQLNINNYILNIFLIFSCIMRLITIIKFYSNKEVMVVMK